MSIKDKIQAYFNSENIELDVQEKVSGSEELLKAEKFEDVTLVDGTVLTVEPALEVGAAVILTVDGEMLPAPDGEHILMDNSVITVEGGLITAIAPAEEVEEEVVEELDSKSTATPTEREAKKVIESIVTEKQFNELKEGFEKLQKECDFLKKDNEEIQKKYTEDFNELGKLFKELFAEPVKEPIKQVKNPLKRESKNIFLTNKKNK